MEKQICVRKRKGTENERKRKGRGKEKERMKEEERKRKNLSICVLMPFLEQVDRYHYIMVSLISPLACTQLCANQLQTWT
jgi:hypothetical protein